jgi:hypothetical protein
MIRHSPFRRNIMLDRLPHKLLLPLLIAPLLLPVSGCQTVRESGYNLSESWLGYAKRERLVDRVEEAQASQEKAKEQFTTTLEQFKSVVNFEGGDLEAAYNKLNKAYERSEDRAEDVRGRIQSVKNVATALFSEWQGEIGEIKDDPSLQAQSQKLFDQTKQSYETLIGKMDHSAATMDPVLTKFKNRVLFLKHNLNAQAIASLQGVDAELTSDIEALIKDMEASIAEADTFINNMKS